MSGLDLNLAGAPFANRRPVRRVAIALWTAAIAVLALDAYLYWAHFAGSGDQQEELVQLREQIAVQTAERDAALARFEQFDIDWQTEQIEFLNARIAERTFAWSALFDHLAEVLPPTVRLARLTPRVATSGGSRFRDETARTAEDEVALELTGVAEDDEVLLTLVDGFYGHERFRRPDLQIESRSDSGERVDFSMSVVYIPKKIEPPGRKPREAKADESDEEPEASPEAEVES